MSNDKNNHGQAIVFLAGEIIACGRYRHWGGLAPSLRHTELAATLHGLGHHPILLAEAGVHLPDDIAALVARHHADALVVCADTVPASVQAALGKLGVATILTTAQVPAPNGTVHNADPCRLAAALHLDPEDGPIIAAPTASVLAPSLRHRVGVELCRRDPDGVVRSNDAHRVAQAITDAFPRSGPDQGPLALHGLELLDAGSSRRVLADLAELTDPSRHPLQARLRLEREDAGPTGGTPSWATAAWAEQAATVLRSVTLEVYPPDDLTGLGSVLATLTRRGLGVSVAATLDDDLRHLEVLVDEVLAAGVELTYVWDDGVGEAVMARGEQTIAPTGSPTLAHQGALGPRPALMTLLSGRSSRPGAGSGIEVAWSAPGADAAPWAAVGLRTEVFAAAPATPGDRARYWPVEAMTGETAKLHGGEGEVSTDGLVLETAGYRQAHNLTPFAPLVLAWHDRSDIESFLSDADGARLHGRFPRALISSFTVLADACAWGEPGACCSDRVGRAVLEPDGTLRLGPHGPIVGSSSQSYPALVRTARALMAAVRAERGCATCPVAAWCSKDLCLSALVPDDAYCSARRARPWLVAYLDAVDAIRRLRRDPAEPLPRVSGFGGPLWPALTDRKPVARPAAVLLQWQGRYYGYVAGNGRVFKMTADTSFVAEALLSAGPEPATTAIARHFQLTPAAALAGADSVRRMLLERGAALAAEPTFPAIEAEDPTRAAALESVCP